LLLLLLLPLLLLLLLLRITRNQQQGPVIKGPQWRAADLARDVAMVAEGTLGLVHRMLEGLAHWMMVQVLMERRWWLMKWRCWRCWRRWLQQFNAHAPQTLDVTTPCVHITFNTYAAHAHAHTVIQPKPLLLLLLLLLLVVVIVIIGIIVVVHRPLCICLVIVIQQ
jgi:hypothetical protein